MRGSSSGQPDELCCPISEELYQDPVLLVETGQTYDRESIEHWFNKGHRTCPLTGKELHSIQIVPNYAVRGLVQAWRESHPNSVNGSSAAAAAEASYPAVFNGDPQHQIEQVDAILKHIRSPSMEVGAACIVNEGVKCNPAVETRKAACRCQRTARDARTSSGS
jgi:hypothetical protein